MCFTVGATLGIAIFDYKNQTITLTDMSLWVASCKVSKHFLKHLWKIVYVSRMITLTKMS